jgi:MFS family permease
MEIDKKDRYFAVNTFGISAVEVLWGLGLPVIIESTFLQLFLKNLGASNKIIGLVPAIIGSGIALFALVSAYLTTHLVHKRRAVVISHVITSVPLILFGIVLFVIGKTPYTVTVFLIFYIIGSLGLGLTIPIWQNFVVKIFSEKNTIPAISIMLLCQTAAKLLGSLIIVKFVERFSFSPSSSGIVFMMVGMVFFAGSFFFLFVREINTGEDYIERDAHNLKTLYRAVIGIIKNRNFMLFLMGTAEAFTCITLISFYANYSVEYHSIPVPLASGMFLVLIYAAGIAVNIVMGWFNLFNLKNKLIVSRLFALCAVAVLLFAHTLHEFLAASFLLGSSRAISSLCFSPSVKRLSGVHDATDYFAVSQLLQLPMSFGIPFLSGIFLDSFSNLGINSYRILFIASGLLIAASLVCVTAIDFDKGRNS